MYAGFIVRRVVLIIARFYRKRQKLSDHRQKLLFLIILQVYLRYYSTKFKIISPIPLSISIDIGAPAFKTRSFAKPS